MKQTQDQKPGEPTRERKRQSSGRFEVKDFTHMGAGRRKSTQALVVADAPLERLFQNGRISGKQFAAGETYRKHWYLAGLSPRVVSHYDAVFADQERSGMPASERQAHYRQLHREAQRALGIHPAQIAQTIILDELDLVEAGRKLFDRKDPSAARASAIDTLGIVLESLVVHYGL